MAAAQTTYDTKNQLLSEQSTRAGGYTFRFAYDPAQNPTTFKGQTRTYNANNQLIGTGFAYDGNGNPVLYKGVSLAFDPENRMTAYGNILTAGYNGDGLRAWKQTASGRRYYLYDGEELVCELDAAGNVATPVVFGANGLVVYSGHIYQFDPQGNAVHIMDNSRNVLANLAYDAWGQLMSGTNPTPYGYKGQWGYYTDVETGILLLTHRPFDPAMGRFLTRDPIGLEGGVNLYAYVGNGVVVLSDNKGLLRTPKGPSPREMPRIGCNADGSVSGLPKTDPAYRCAQEVCRWWAKQYREIGDLVKKLCNTLIDCAETNRILPPIPHEHPCWRRGGTERPHWVDEWIPNLCCVECQKRVCFWFEQPAEQLLNSVRDSRLRRCWQQYHGL